MSQIVKKKKGRPSKADLAARAAAAESANGHHRRRTAEEEEEEEEERDIRRSLRRRSGVRYNLLDYDDDDYLDDDDEFEFDFDDGRPEAEGGGGGRREKKLKFVLKLNNSSDSGRAVRSNGGGGDSAVRGRRAGFRRSESEEEDEEEEEDRFVKKRKISVDADEDDEADDDFGNNYDEEERGGRDEYHKADFADGVPSRTPMPEKKRLELILDKLQKKDTYGAYAEPVGPDELPDYHDIIKHPMDFATVRKKLANGSYSIFEQFESDVYLICSNAMEYNTPETIYHKQARAIKELAQRKFHRVRAYIKQTRIENEGTKKEANSEQQAKPYPIIKKQMKKPLGHSAQDPVSSDFLHGATPATTDAHNTSSDVQASNHERHSNSEGHAEGISSLGEDNAEKVEDLQSGKGMTKLGRKSLVLDENRRATYEISNQPVDRSESIFATFEGEDKQLIPVGLYGEHSYAQSLAHYAATLGPVAWGTTSKIIEQALPQGSKFGRGWVVEYEPIPTPVLFVADQAPREFSSARKEQSPAVSAKMDKACETPNSSIEHLGAGGPSLNGKPCFFPGFGGRRPTTPSGSLVQVENPFVRKLQNAANLTEHTSADDRGQKRPISDAKPPQMPTWGGHLSATSTGAAIQQQNQFNRRLQSACFPAKINEPVESIVTTSGCLESGSNSEGKSSILPTSRGSRSNTPTGPVIHPQNPFSRNNSTRPENPVSNRMDPSAPSLTNQKMNPFVQKQFPGNAEMPNSRGSRPSTPTGPVIDHQDPFTRNNSLRPENSVSNRMDPNAPTLTNHKTNPFVQKQFPGNAEMSTSRGSRPSTPTGPVIDHQDPFSRNNSTRPENSVSNRMDPNAPTLTNHKTNPFVQKQFSGNAEMSTSRGSRPNTPTGPVIDHQNPFSRNNSMRTENSAANRMDANAPSLTNQKTNHFVQKQLPGSAEMPNSWPEDTNSKNKNFLQQPLPRRPPLPAGEGVISGRPPNGNVNHYLDINQIASSPSSGAKIPFPPRPEQGLSDPLQAMRLSAENAQKQQIKMNNLFGPMPFRPSVQTLRGDNMTAGVAWMHASSGDINRHTTGNLSVHSNQIPAKSSYNNTQELYPHILQSGEYPASGSRYFHPERSKATFEEHVSDHVKASNDAHVQNRSMVFPLQSPRQGLSPHTEQKRKQDTLPPDLNVAFQSTADPQQPDLALQL